jgi:outer membrane protein, multidrug efflux system
MTPRSARALAIAALLTLGLAGCAVGPDYARPKVAVPEKFYGEERAREARAFADVAWWEVFEDRNLSALVEEAVKNGFDARLAAARVLEARARFGIARSAFYPDVDARGGWQRVRPDQSVNPAGATATLWSAEAVFAWELDVWGRIRRLNEAARAEYLATEEGRRAVLLSLASDVATAYLDLCELDEELEIATKTTGAFQDTYDLFNRRLEGGAASALETERAKASLAQVAAQIPEIRRAIVARETQLSVLLGRNPGPIARERKAILVPPDVPEGLPSSLLERRPDIREAEQLMISANAQIGVAKADFFPRLSLTGLLGNVSFELGDLFSQGNTWSLGAGLLAPVFHGGSIRRGYEAAQARWEQARVRYEATVASAFGDVSRALVDRTELAETERQRVRAVASYQEAVRFANIRYTAGRSAYFEVLEAQQQLFPAEISLAQTRRARLVAVVNLYRALGGGWSVAAP